ncbi:hypothetical protein GCM10018791_14000 [Streptomyces zaomyceticus]|nr:hypothetical protein GCM10018791_14000 [Streptomyces zaomyceticus]
MAGAAWAPVWAVRATAAAAVAVSTVTRMRLGCLGRRWDATKASSFFLRAAQPVRGRRFLRRHPGWVINRAKVRSLTLVTKL